MKRTNVVKYVATGVLALACLGASSAYAASIALSADNLNYFATKSGAWLNDGCLVEMGQFTISDLTLQSYAADGQISAVEYSSLLSSFVPLNGSFSTTIGTGTTTVPSEANSGAFTFGFTGNNAGWESTPVYLMVFNSSSSATATQVGVFRGNASWSYPSSMATGAINISVDNALTTPLIGSYVGDIDGSTNPYNWGDNGNGNALVGQLRLIPEPSTFLLVGVGLLGVLGLRRRHS